MKTSILDFSTEWLKANRSLYISLNTGTVLQRLLFLELQSKDSQDPTLALYDKSLVLSFYETYMVTCCYKAYLLSVEKETVCKKIGEILISFN